MLQINGYTINPAIDSIKELLEVMSRRGVVAHSKSQAKSILRLMRLIGVKHISHCTSPDVLEINAPSCKAESDRIYKVESYKGMPVVSMWTYTDLPPYVLEVNDVISSKSWTTWIQDL